MKLDSGYLIVLPRDEAKAFFGCRDDQSRLDYLNELLDRPDVKKLCCDGKWQSIHDALAAIELADSVLAQCLLGGRPMHSGNAYHVNLVRPDVVGFIAEQGSSIDDTHVAADLYPTVQAVVGLYREAAEMRAAVVFYAQAS